MLEVKEESGGGIRILNLYDGQELLGRAVLTVRSDEVHLEVGDTGGRRDYYDLLARSALHKLRDYGSLIVRVEESDYFAALGFVSCGDGSAQIACKDIDLTRHCAH